MYIARILLGGDVKNLSCSNRLEGSSPLSRPSNQPGKFPPLAVVLGTFHRFTQKALRHVQCHLRLRQATSSESMDGNGKPWKLSREEHHHTIPVRSTVKTIKNHGHRTLLNLVLFWGASTMNKWKLTHLFKSCNYKQHSTCSL